MGYFSSLASEDMHIHPDHSVVLPQQQLLWRLEDLQDRLQTLREKGAVYSSSRCCDWSILRYGLPGSFCAEWEVEKAIELAVCDLQEHYGIAIGGQADPRQLPVQDELTGNQLSIYMILPPVALPKAV